MDRVRVAIVIVAVLLAACLGGIALTERVSSAGGPNDMWQVSNQATPSRAMFVGTEAQADAFTASLPGEGEGTMAFDIGPHSTSTTTTTKPTVPTTTTTTTTVPISKYCKKHPNHGRKCKAQTRG